MDKIEENELGTKSIGKLLFSMDFPAITAQIINLLYNLVDRVYIGHIPEVGATALTGVGVVFPIIMLISAFAALVSMGGAPKGYIMMGRENKDALEKILGNSTSALVIISIILITKVLIFGEKMLLTFGASENTIGYGLDYIRIYAYGTIFVQLAHGLSAFITAQGFAKMSMLTVTSVIFNSILLLKSCLVYSTVIWAAVMIFLHVFIKVFTNNIELINLTIPSIRIFMAVSLIFGIQLSSQ